MSALLNNPSFWVAVAFAIFLVVAWKYVWPALAGALDEHSAKIRADLAEAERLRDEAKVLLDQYQRKHRESLAEAEAIVARAREEATRIAADASVALDQALKRREQQTLDKIAQAETAALRDVRNQAVDVAIAAARRIVAEELKGERGGKLVEAAIKELPGKLH